LRECLTALAKQKGNVNAQVIVADCVARINDISEDSASKRPLISFAEKQSVPKLRAVALAQATANYRITKITAFRLHNGTNQS